MEISTYLTTNRKQEITVERMKPASVNMATKATFNIPLHGLHTAYSTTPKYTGWSKSLCAPYDYSTKK